MSRGGAQVTAGAIIVGLVCCSENVSLWTIRRDSRYRRQVGQVMGLFYIDVLRELFKQYPDLEPASLK
jgi:hypothetical protein